MLAVVALPLTAGLVAGGTLRTAPVLQGVRTALMFYVPGAVMVVVLVPPLRRALLRALDVLQRVKGWGVGQGQGHLQGQGRHRARQRQWLLHVD